MDTLTNIEALKQTELFTTSYNNYFFGGLDISVAEGNF